MPSMNFLQQQADEDDGLGPLPPKWEKAYTENGETYFIEWVHFIHICTLYILWTDSCVDNISNNMMCIWFDPQSQLRYVALVGSTFIQVSEEIARRLYGRWIAVWLGKNSRSTVWHILHRPCESANAIRKSGTRSKTPQFGTQNEWNQSASFDKGIFPISIFSIPKLRIVFFYDVIFEIH